MPHWVAGQRVGSPTSCALYLFALCLTVIILDVATFDEFNAAPTYQPALLDGEDIDPSKATASPSSSDHQRSSPILLSANNDDQKAVPTFVRLVPTRYLATGSLTSRPPPIA